MVWFDGMGEHCCVDKPNNDTIVEHLESFSRPTYRRNTVSDNPASLLVRLTTDESCANHSRRSTMRVHLLTVALTLGLPALAGASAQACRPRMSQTGGI